MLACPVCGKKHNKKPTLETYIPDPKYFLSHRPHLVRDMHNYKKQWD